MAKRRGLAGGMGSWRRNSEEQDLAVGRAGACVVEQLEKRALLSGAVSDLKPDAMLADQGGGEQEQHGQATMALIEALEVVGIPDADLEAAVRAALSKPAGDITSEDMAGLTSLAAGSRGIHDLSGLEYATNLEQLDLRDNQISDLTPLAPLMRLRAVNVSHNDLRVTPGSYSLVLIQRWIDANANVTYLPQNANQQPIDINLSGDRVPADQPAATQVGVLFTTDPDGDRDFTYMLVAGAGDDDNPLFFIDGNILRTADLLHFDFGTDHYSIRVRTTDHGGLTFEKEFAIRMAEPIATAGQWGGTVLEVVTRGATAYVCQGQSLVVMDVSEPSSPRDVGRVIIPELAVDGTCGIEGLAVADNYAYVAVGDKGLVMIDISTPTAPRLVRRYDTIGFLSGVSVVGRYAYLAEDVGLEIIDITKPLIPGPVCWLATTGSIARVDVVGNYAYVGSSKGIGVIDISNPTRAMWVGECNLPSEYGVTDLSVVGRYAYVADAYDLAVVDISTPANPFVLADYKTVDWVSAVSVVGDYVYAADVFYGLEVIDVSTPSAPAFVGGYDTPGNAWGVSAESGYAYIADFDSGLQVIDVSTASRPTLAGEYKTAGMADYVQVVGSYAYVADGNNGLMVMDVSEPAFPRLVGTYTTSGRPRGLSVVGNYAYIAESYTGLEVVDISNPAAPVLVGQYGSVGEVVSVNVVGDYAYIADCRTLMVLDVSTPSSPALVGQLAMSSGNVRRMTVVGSYAYVVDFRCGLEIVDISVPSNPQLVGPPTEAGYFNEWVSVAGNYAYVAGASDGLYVFDISVPSAPVNVYQYSYPASFTSVTVAGGRLYATVTGFYNDDVGMLVFDLTTPSAPKLVGSHSMPGYAYAVSLAGNYAYIADNWNGLCIAYLENQVPADIALVGTTLVADSPAGTAVGTVYAFDPDSTEAFTYALVDGEGSDDNVLFSISGNTLLMAQAISAPSQQGITSQGNRLDGTLHQVAALAASTARDSYSIRVRTTDQGGLYTEKVFTIAVTNTNETPTDVTLSNASVAECQPIGTVVGTLGSSDPDLSDTFAYSLVAGTGSGDNAAFSISGNQLQTAASFDYEAKSSYSIRVRSTDAGGLCVERTFTITVTPAVVDIPDANLQAAIRAKLNKPTGDITAADMLGLTDLDASGRGIADLTGLEYATQLKVLDLSSNQITNVTPLAGLKQVTQLILARNLISDVTPLTGMTQLGSLILDSNPITDVSPLGALPRLGKLILRSVSIDVTTLAGLTQLYWLVLQNNHISDITPLAGLTNLTTLYVEDNLISDLTPLAGMTRMWSLVLVNNQISNITPLVGMTQLTSVYLDGNQITDVSPLAGLANLVELGLNDNRISDLTPISGMTQLCWIELRYNNLDVSAGSPAMNVIQGWLDQGDHVDYLPQHAAPTDISLSNSSIAENQPVGTVVGSLGTMDADADETFAYSLVAGTGSADNSSFSISCDRLLTAGSFDYEAQSNYTIRVRTTDHSGLGFEKVFTIVVANVNESPTDVALSAAGIAENQPGGTVVGGFSSADPDAGDTFRYLLVGGAGSGDNSSFMISGNQLQTVASFDYEVKSSYSIRVRTTDQGGLYAEKVLTIVVTNINETPADITLSNASMPENQATGAVVATLGTIDPDTGDTFVYTLVSGAGSTDDDAFAISGGTLQTAAVFDFEGKSSYSIRIRTTDAGGLYTEKTFAISVTDVNEAPTGIALSNVVVAENQAAGTAVGDLSSSDQDAGDTLTYSLVPGTGSDDNGSFTISAGQLLTASSFDYEGRDSYSVRVRTTDSGGLWFEKVFAVAVMNVNETPTDVAVSNTSVAENQAAGTVVGMLASSDPDAGEVFTYSLVSGAGGDDNNSVTISGGELLTASSFDHEAKDSYSIRVRSTDAGGLYFEKVFVIGVTDVNEMPMDMALSSIVVQENQASGTGVGTLSTSDPDAGETFTYALAGGDGSTDNGLFHILGSALQTSACFDYEARSSYSIRVRVTDHGGLSYEKPLAITVTDDPDDLRGSFGLIGGKTVALPALVDADGDQITFKLNGGGVGVVYGYDKTFQDIVLSGTNAKSILTVSVKKNKHGGDGLVTIGNITSDGLIKCINASTAMLSGLVRLNTVNQPAGKAAVAMKFRQISNADIRVQGLPVSSIAVGGDVSDSRIVTTGSIKKFSAVTLLDSDILVGVATNCAEHFAAADDFANVTAKLGSLKVSGRKLPSGNSHPAYVAGSHISAPSVGVVTLLNVPDGSGPVVHVLNDVGTLKVSQSKVTSTAMFESGTWKVTGARPAIWDVV